jgi:tetratricopeptide (TPR) repeat protein
MRAHFQGLWRAAVGVCLLRLCGPAAAQDVRAEDGSIAINGNVVGSTLNIGVSQGKLDKIIREIKKPYEELTATQKETIGLLKDKLDLNRRQIIAALNILGEANVEPENLTAKLVEVAQHYKDLLASAASQPDDTPAIAARKAEAQQALDAGELDKADALLGAVAAEQQQIAERAVAIADRAVVNAAETSAKRGDLAMLRLRYREAAKYFAEAAAFLARGKNHEDRRIGYLDKEEKALFRQGTDFGETDAVRSAVERCRVLIELKPRERVPVKWARAQRRLGVVLTNLGEREKGTARFEEALTAFAHAQEELTRASRPGGWAIVEVLRGEALERIALREHERAAR